MSSRSSARALTSAGSLTNVLAFLKGNYCYVKGNAHSGRYLPHFEGDAFALLLNLFKKSFMRFPMTPVPGDELLHWIVKFRTPREEVSSEEQRSTTEILLISKGVTP